MPQRLLDNCKNCNVKLDESNFVFTKTSRLNSCRACYNKYKRRVNTANYQEHVKENKEYHRKYSLKRLYNIDPYEYKFKLECQLGGCAICKLPFNEERKVAVDHDHTTGQTRDLLCYRCNNILGLCNDNELLLSYAVDYLKRHERKTA
jgi:hypothetical protein